MTAPAVYRVELTHEVSQVTPELRWHARVYRIADNRCVTTRVASTALRATEDAKAWVAASYRLEPPRQAVYLDERGFVTGAPGS